MPHSGCEDRRQALKRAAIQLACRLGYDRASIRRIAEACGVTVGLIYHHFENKQELFKEAILERSFLPHLERLLPKVRQMPVEEGLVEIGKAFLTMLSQRSETFTVLVGESFRNPEMKEIFSELIRKIRNLLVGYIREKMEAGEIRPANPELLVQMFHGHLVTGFLYRQRLNIDVGHIQEEEWIRQSVRIFLYGIHKEG